MRIIKNGIEIEIKCPHCNSILAISPEDVHDCAAVGSWVVCVACDKGIRVEGGKFPFSFKSKVNWDDGF